MIGHVTFAPQFAKNRIDTTFHTARDGELEHFPSPRDQERLAWDDRNIPQPQEGAFRARNQ